MPLRVLGTDLHVVNMRTRMPFRYGIVTVRAVPHVFVRAEVEIDGARHIGLAAENLAIKWFTKDPNVSAHYELAKMRDVIQTACDVARAAGKHRSVYDWWLHVYQGQTAWGGGWGIPPLLTHLGTSLVERAVIDAFCRSQATPFARIVRENRLGVRIWDLHPEIGYAEPSQYLPAQASQSVIARHTVGMTDPLTDADITPDERLNDSLPQSLEACVREYGLTHFKIKLSGDVGDDVERLRRIADLLAKASPAYRYTLDANENFPDVETFRAFWSRLNEEASMRDFVTRLIVAEQPLHRDVSMTDHTARELRNWADRPPIIIDESDAEITSASKALDRGYVGTSHKNCKGVIKSIANACLLEHRRRTSPGGAFVMTAEDLTTVGPVALQEDLAVVGTLGIEHVERNGHHYLRGLSMFPRDTVDPIVAHHEDVYRRLADGTPALRIEGGRIAIGSVVDAPFGLAATFDPTRFEPLTTWDPATISST